MLPGSSIGDSIDHYPEYKELIIKALRILNLASLVITSIAAVIKALPIFIERRQSSACDVETSSPTSEDYNPTPINNGFKKYYIQIDLNPFPKNAALLYKGKEVGLTRIWIGRHKIDYGIDTQHSHVHGEEYVVLGIGSVWSWMPAHWGWQNPENWQVIYPCP